MTATALNKWTSTFWNGKDVELNRDIEGKMHQTEKNLPQGINDDIRKTAWDAKNVFHLHLCSSLSVTAPPMEIEFNSNEHPAKVRQRILSVEQLVSLTKHETSSQSWVISIATRTQTELVFCWLCQKKRMRSFLSATTFSQIVRRRRWRSGLCQILLRWLFNWLERMSSFCSTLSKKPEVFTGDKIERVSVVSLFFGVLSTARENTWLEHFSSLPRMLYRVWFRRPCTFCVFCMKIFLVLRISTETFWWSNYTLCKSVSRAI